MKKSQLKVVELPSLSGKRTV